ncbi:MAG: SnoaL-like domain-containing protein [Pseudomonadota bacterium]
MFDETLMKTANALLEHCRNGTEDAGLVALYADDAVSVEALAMEGGMGPVFEGLEAIKGKHAWWNANTEVHSSSFDGPFFHGEDRFGVIFQADVTMKQSGERWENMKELGLYTVKDGKIVREEFYFSA